MVISYPSIELKVKEAKCGGFTTACIRNILTCNTSGVILKTQILSGVFSCLFLSSLPAFLKCNGIPIFKSDKTTRVYR